MTIADRDVDEEDRPPAPTEEIDLNERTPEDLTGDRPEPDRDAEPRERAMALRGREERGDQRENLWHHHRGAEALHEPRETISSAGVPANPHAADAT